MLNLKTHHGLRDRGYGRASGTLAISLLASLCALPQQALAYDERGRLHNPASWRSTEFQSNWGLHAIGADYAYARGLSGIGVNLGMLDTGTDLRHPQFQGADHKGLILAEPGCHSEQNLSVTDGCFFTRGDLEQVIWNDVPAEDILDFEESVAYGLVDAEELQHFLENVGVRADSHGTHVAGTLLANRDGEGVHGVAWGSQLHAMRHSTHAYFSPAPIELEPRSLTLSAISDAHAQLRQQQVRVVNHSWGLDERLWSVAQLDLSLQGAPGQLGNALGNASRQFGLLQVWAAGNTPDSANLSPESAPFADTLPTLPRLYPELEPYWLSVVNVNQHLTLSDRSMRCGYSQNWCLAAPGTDINSTVVTTQIEAETTEDMHGETSGFKIIADRPTFTYQQLSGTSMAAPHVTGGLALLMERFPYLDNAQIRDVLLTTARDIGAPGVDDIYGWGLMDLKKAIEGPGQLRVDTHVAMNAHAGGAKVWQGLAWDDWRNDISGPGHLSKSGPGWLRLSGNNTFAGATLYEGTLELQGVQRLTNAIQVNGGRLLINGTLFDTALNVNNGMAHIAGQQLGAYTRVGPTGFLGGDGELSHTQVLGTLAPGSADTALTVNGDYAQGRESIFMFNPGLLPAQPALKVTGTALLHGGTLHLIPQAEVITLGQRYAVLEADAGVYGQFTSVDHRAISPFLRIDQTHDSHALGLEVSRGVPLLSAANTSNQRATANAADRLAVSHPLAQRLTALFPADAPHALDQLSGQLHASTTSVLIESSRVMRNAALEHASNLHRPAQHESPPSRQAVWVQSLHNNGRIDGNGNAQGAQYTLTGVLLGADHDFEQGTRLGVMMASGQGDVKTGASGKATLDAYQVGLYAGHTWDAFGLYGGLAYAHHTVQSKRRVTFTGLNETLSSDAKNHTQQAFIEGRYRWQSGIWDIQPYLQLAHVRLQRETFNEQGGHGALKVRSPHSAVNLATGGVRFTFDMGKTSSGPAWLSVTSGAAYTRASGGLRPVSDVAWQNSTTMHISGAPVNQASTQLDIGAVARLTRDSAFKVSTNHQRGDRAREHGITAHYSFAF